MKTNQIISLYPNIDLKKKIFYLLRSSIAPFDEVIAELPQKGVFLDVGCGHGFLTNMIALNRPKGMVWGIDVDASRIATAKQSVGQRKNLKFTLCDVTKDDIPARNIDHIICFDILHHIPFHTQEKIIQQSSKILKKGHKLIIKDIDTEPWIKYYWNYLHDKIVTKGAKLYFRPNRFWLSYLIKNNFSIEKFKKIKKGLFYPHVLIIATKN